MAFDSNDSAFGPSGLSENIVQASRRTKRAWLKPVTDDDIELLFRMESAVLGEGWRVGGSPPHPIGYGERLWRGVWRQDLVIERDSGRPVGWMVCYSADLANRHASVAAASFASNPNRPFAEGAARFLTNLFVDADFRQLYCDVAEFNLRNIGRFLATISDTVCVIPGYFLWNGREWDLHRFIIDRGSWMSGTYRHYGDISEHDELRP